MNERLSDGKRLFDLGVKLMAWGFFCLSLLCFFMVSLMIYNGGVWAYIIYVAKPFHNLASGIVSLFVWYLLRYGIHNTQNEWKNFAARMLLLTFSFTFSLGAAELILRTYYTVRQNANSMERFKAARKNGKPLPIVSSHPLAAIIQPSDNQKLGYELQPGLDFDFGHRRVRTNTEGMRKDREYPIQKTADGIRIIGIGDSGMFGWDLEQNENYMDILEADLNKRQDGKCYEALNLAVPGYNTQLEVEMLRYKGLKYKPDIVIIGWCENDYSLPMFMLQKENYKRRDISFLYNFMFKRGKKLNTEVSPGMTIHDLRQYDNKLVLPELTTGTDVTGVRTALLELKQLGEQAGFKILVFGPMKELICHICRDAGVQYTSTYELIPEGKYPEEYLVYYMHPKKEGHRILAEYLEKDLVRREWLQPAAETQNNSCRVSQ